MLFSHLIPSRRDQMTIAALLGMLFWFSLLLTRGEKFAESGPDELRTECSKPYKFQVDPNRASAAELQTLPGVGEKLAEAILREREDFGPFQKSEDLLDVRGIGQKRLEAIQPYLPTEYRDAGLPNSSR